MILIHKLSIDINQYIDSREIKKFTPYKETLKGQYSHPPKNTFLTGIDIKRPVILTDKPNCSSLVRPEVYSRLLMIGKSAQDHQPAAKALLEWVAKTVNNSSDSPHFFDLVAIFICLQFLFVYLDYANFMI